ncbi:hypothetical protein W822_17310 [Advenella kashmirensis W13003]|uniref:Uncharacterized protein n=1 Tax=Advenella kashmirensis W13003 TaxID=1424334 RepID=V8QQX2_9BURK|nr:hypothetical protein W822_17310 [Advenella kashmirensis W13003]
MPDGYFSIMSGQRGRLMSQLAKKTTGNTSHVA